jgi:hypothetical protein
MFIRFNYACLKELNLVDTFLACEIAVGADPAWSRALAMLALSSRG